MLPFRRAETTESGTADFERFCWEHWRALASRLIPTSNRRCRTKRWAASRTTMDPILWPALLLSSPRSTTCNLQMRIRSKNKHQMDPHRTCTHKSHHFLISPEYPKPPPFPPFIILLCIRHMSTRSVYNHYMLMMITKLKNPKNISIRRLLYYYRTYILYSKQRVYYIGPV